MATEITEREARPVAEEAREGEWKLPSFGRDLFLGNLRLDLIHPQPRLDAAAVQKGERFLERLRAFLLESVDPLAIERDARIPDAVIDGLKELGALGMKVPEEYGGLGLSQVYYNRALVLAGSMHASLSTLLSAHQTTPTATRWPRACSAAASAGSRRGSSTRPTGRPRRRAARRGSPAARGRSPPPAAGCPRARRTP